MTVSPEHSDDRWLRAAAEAVGGRVSFFDPDDPEWPAQVLASGCDGHMMRIRHDTSVRRALDGGRLQLLHLRRVPAWPAPLELYLYEDKAQAAWALAALGVPHVETHVFTRESDALRHLEAARYPLVVKTRAGSSGTGVERLDDPAAARAFARHVFRGRHQRLGTDHRDADFDYLIVQPMWQGAAEHRVIKLGSSYFAHGKALTPQGGWRYSGSGQRVWELPGWHVLDTGRAIAETIDLECGAIDMLEAPDGAMAVIEVQHWYGGYRAAQMDVDGVPGRARWDGDRWCFEEGAFHVNRGHNLRLLAFDDWLTRRSSAGAAGG